MVETYVVQRGDTLGRIALNKLGDGKRWPEIVQLNAVSNPNFLLVGQQLKLPVAQKPGNFRPTFQTPGNMDAAALSQVPASLAWARGYLLVLFNHSSVLGVASLAKDFSVLPRNLGDVAAITERELVIKGAPLVDGKPVRLDANKVRVAGGFVVPLEQTIGDLRQFAGQNAGSQSRIEKLIATMEGADKKTDIAGQVKLVAGLIFTSKEAADANEHSLNTNLFKQIPAEAIRQIGGWSNTSLGAKIGSCSGAAFGIDTPQAGVTTGNVGAIVFNALEYLALEVRA